jgi:hypothetical protein
MPSSGIAAVPADFFGPCPRCKIQRLFNNVSQGSTLYSCNGCEWRFNIGTQAPTGTTNAAITAGVNTTISVASGGASFTNLMYLMVDGGTSAEVVRVVGTATGTSIPVPGGFAQSHNSGASFGQLLLTPASVTAQRVPANPGWGF